MIKSIVDRIKNVFTSSAEVEVGTEAGRADYENLIRIHGISGADIPVGKTLLFIKTTKPTSEINTVFNKLTPQRDSGCLNPIKFASKEEKRSSGIDKTSFVNFVDYLEQSESKKRLGIWGAKANKTFSFVVDELMDSDKAVLSAMTLKSLEKAIIIKNDGGKLYLDHCFEGGKDMEYKTNICFVDDEPPLPEDCKPVGHS